MNDKDYLKAKADGVSDIVKWLKAEMKTLKKDLDKHQPFDYIYNRDYDMLFEKERMETLVSIKASTEKYMKKLRHDADKI